MGCSNFPPGCKPVGTTTFIYTSYCLDDASTTSACPLTTNSAISTCNTCVPAASSGDTVASTTSTTSTLISLSSSQLSTTSAPASSTLSGALSSPTVAPISGTSIGPSSVPSGGLSSGTSNGTNLPPGAGVGIGIGCALAGALIAGLIAFVLFRRKRQQSSYPQQYLPFHGGGNMGQEKYGMVATTREVKEATATNVDRLLPQPAEDDAIIGGLSKIRDGIKNHVQNYYYSGPISYEMVDEARLVDLSQATGIPTSALQKFLFNPTTRLPTIRLFLGHLILSRCQGRTDGQPSFLPNEVSGLAAYQSSANNSNSYQTQSALFSKWKTISGVLLQQQYSQQPGSNDVRNGNIAQILATAEPVLHPFINPNIDMNARQHNLEGVMKRAAQFAFLLFSQPGSFNFDFRGMREPDSLLVFPAFLQIVSDEGEILLPPRVLSETEVVSGLGI